MAAIVGVDAKIQFSTDGGSSWVEISERNEFTISIKTDMADHRVFVATLADAWSNKQRTWMSWSGNLRGYYDDADDTIFTTMLAGAAIKIRFYDSRASSSKYWEGVCVLGSVEHQTTNRDYATLNVDFDGNGALSRVS